MGETPQKVLDRALAAKLARRRELAQLPFEEKVRMVLRLRELSRTLKQAKRND